MIRVKYYARKVTAAAACCGLIAALGTAAAQQPPPAGGPGAPNTGMPAEGMPPASAGGMPPGGAGSGALPPEPPVPVFPDNPAAAAHRATAMKAAGTRWQSTYDFYCVPGRHPSKMHDVLVEPQWIFDNVGIIGDRSTAMFVLKTSAGVMLIDTGFSDTVESTLLPQLAKLGVDPANVKTIIVSHGHPDHFGGAPYFQMHYGTRIVASDADWDMITKPPTMLPPHPEPWMTAAGPTKDVAVGDGGEVVLGDLRVKTFLVPGHTPGSLGLIFPVKDHGKTRMAAIFGGAILAEARTQPEFLKQFVQSLAHFGDVTRKDHVDVELQNHPAFDDTWVKAQALRDGKPGAPNPFVVGQKDYQNFLTVISECTQGLVAQRE